MNNINKEVIQQVKDAGLDMDESVLYLLCVKYEITKYLNLISDETKKSIILLNICYPVLDNNNKTQILWNIPLFEEEKDKVNITFDWVNHWREGFKKININRAGEKQTSIQRMKKLFELHPTLTKEDCYLARDYYFTTVSSPTFLKKAHKFILEGTSYNLTSELIENLEICKMTGFKKQDDKIIKGLIED